MAKYEITAPDGKRFEITAPEGSTEQDVMKFAQSQWQAQPKEEKPISKMGLLKQAAQGLSFGTSDEIAAGIAAPFGAYSTGNNIKDAYSDIHQSLQDDRNTFKSENPKSALAAELVGGLATGGAGATKMAAMQGVKNLKPLAQAMVVGGTEGAVYGTAAADRGERLEGGAVGGALGAVGAPVLDLGAKVVKHLGKPIVDRAKQAMLGSNKSDAVKYLSEALAREGFDSVDDIAKTSRGDANLADLTESGRGALEGIVADVQNPGVKKLVRETLLKRNDEQQSRIFGNLYAKMGISPEMTVKDAVKAVKADRAAKAKPLYDEARSKSVQFTPYMKAVLHERTGVPELKTAFKEAEKRMATKRASGEKVSHIDILDEMKRVLDDDIEGLLRQGSRNRARDLIQVKNNILKDVDAQIPSYKAARNSYAGDSALLDAAERGKRIFREDIDNLDDLVEGMVDSEKEMFRLGAIKTIREKMMMAREGTNSVNRIASELNLEKIRKAFPTDESFNEFKKDIKFEASIFDTSRVLHNSATAIRQASQKDMDEFGSGLFEEVTGDKAGLISGAIKQVIGKRLTPEAKEELGKILLMPLSELPPELADKLTKNILKQLPERNRKWYTDILDGLTTGTTATAPTAIINSEE